MNLELMNSAAGVIVSAVLNSFVFSLGITAAAWALCRFVPGINAATRHVIWWGVLASFAAIPFAQHMFHTSEAAASLRPTVPMAVAYPAPISSPAPQAFQQEDTPSAISIRVPFEIRAGYLPLIAIAVWLVILIVQLGRVLSSYVYLRRIKLSSVPAPRQLRIGFDEWMLGCGVGREARLLISDNVESPMAAGFLRPAVIVPQAMTQQLGDQDLDHVVLHELAHLARHDDWTNLLARIAAGFFALHPVAAWVLRRIDTEREVACDDWVVAMTGASKPYAVSLARLAEFRLGRRREMLATGIGGRRSQFGSRIERLLSATVNCDARASAGKVAMSLCVLLVLVFTATQAPQWLAFAQEAAPVRPDPPMIPAGPAAPVYAATPPRAAPVSATIPHPPALPLAGTLEAHAFVPVPPAGAAGADVHPVPPVPPLPRTFAFATPAPPLPPSAQAPATPGTSPRTSPRTSNDEKGGSFLAALASAGYKDLSVDDIINLKNHGITASYLAAMNKAGWGRLTTEQLVQLRNHGVTPQYLQEMSDVGLKSLTLQDTIDLSNNGVRPETLREITMMGFGPYTVRQIIELSNHGARPEFFRALKDAGFLRADLREILDAVNHGLRASDLREAKAYGSNLTLRQIIRLKSSGVI